MNKQFQFVSITSIKLCFYLRGLNLISNGGDYYLFNAHGDVIGLTNSSGTSVKTHSYDVFGVEKNPDSADTNYFRYCGEYWDTETETYYLRARYYDPALGRFTQEDTHWSTANMIYGDNPQKINEREDKLGLKSYSYAPQISAIMQSGNLYVYCVNSPTIYIDPTGFDVTKEIPPTEKDGYIAPKGGPIVGKDKNGNKGWVDKNGNIWIPVPDGSPQAHGGGHWDVQRPDGRGYVNRYPGGIERKGSGKAPHIPNMVSKYNNNPSKIKNVIRIFIYGATTVGTGYVLYRAIRLIPSFIPPLWWLLPINLFCP